MNLENHLIHASYEPKASLRMVKQALSDRTIKALEAPVSGQVTVWDEALPDLVCASPKAAQRALWLSMV